MAQITTSSHAPPHSSADQSTSYSTGLRSGVGSGASSVSSMGQRLHGKTILITGASSGIGRSTAWEFARTSPRALKLILAARRVDTLRQLAEAIPREVGNGVQVLPVELDVRSRDNVRRFFQDLPEPFRQIDVLVNNAGLVRGLDRAPDIADADINVMFQTNVLGLIHMTQEVLKIYRARPDSSDSSSNSASDTSGGRGDIINIGSIAGREPYAGGSIYCATKAAIRSFTDALRRELIHTRIRIMEIDPGQVETEFSLVRFRGDKDRADAVYAGCEPMTPDDIAEAVVFAAGRRENVVVADMLLFPSHQQPSKSKLTKQAGAGAGAGAMHRKPT